MVKRSLQKRTLITTRSRIMRRVSRNKSNAKRTRNYRKRRASRNKRSTKRVRKYKMRRKSWGGMMAAAPAAPQLYTIKLGATMIYGVNELFTYISSRYTGANPHQRTDCLRIQTEIIILAELLKKHHGNFLGALSEFTGRIGNTIYTPGAGQASEGFEESDALKHINHIRKQIGVTGTVTETWSRGGFGRSEGRNEAGVKRPDIQVKDIVSRDCDIVSLTPLSFTIKNKTADGKESLYAHSCMVYVDGTKEVYICDPHNSKILIPIAEYGYLQEEATSPVIQIWGYNLTE